MGKLNIAHHKSYHPYRRDNIERVRRDEEEARLLEAAKEGKVVVAVRDMRFEILLLLILQLQDAEARIELLRQRAGLASQSKAPVDDIDTSSGAGPSSLTSGGHINLFEDLERVCFNLVLRIVFG